MNDKLKTFLSGNTFVPVGSAIAIAIAVWQLGSCVNEFKSNINNRFDALEGRMDTMNDSLNKHYSNEWGYMNMKVWTYHFEKLNPTANVPDPLLVKKEGF